MCVCLWQQPAYCVVKCNRLLHGASSALSECPAAWLSLSRSLFPPSLFHLLLCRRATFFTFLAAFTKQAGNISVINIGLAALPSSSGAISCPGSAWVSLFLSSSRSCSQFLFVSLSLSLAALASTSSSCAPAKHLRTAAACPHIIQIQTEDTHAHTQTTLQSFTHKSNYRRSLTSSHTRSLCQRTLSCSLSPFLLSPFWLFGRLVSLRPLLPAAVVSRWRCLRQKEVVARPPSERKARRKAKKKRRIKNAEQSIIC